MKNVCNLFLLLIIAFPASLIANEIKITIIHTNDLHSHLLGFSPNIDYTPMKTGDDTTVGGFSRIAAVIKKEKMRRENPVLILDAGDFMVGTLFHTVSFKGSAELRLMKAMGYNAVTLGNHEFDFKPNGLAKILSSSHNKGEIPDIVFSSAIFSKESNEDDALEKVFNAGIVKPYLVIEREGIRIGLFGVMGKHAAKTAPFASPVKFRAPVDISREIVQLLRNKEKVDIVICLSHSGVRDKKSESEDEILAEEVPGIDIIVSGHSHTELRKPIIINNTIIVQAWEYGKHVGILDVIFDKGKTIVEKYKIVEIDDRIKGDEEIQKEIDSIIKIIDQKVLNNVGHTFWDVIAKTDFDLGILQDESNLGNLITDSIRWYLDKIDRKSSDVPTDTVVAIESSGLIRDFLLKGETGKITVCDLFRTVPFGIGHDETPGFPLVTFYLFASEIKKGMEILASIAPFMGRSCFLQVSGIRVSYNPHRIVFDKITDIAIGSEEVGYKPLDYTDSNRKLYRIACNIFTASFIKMIGGFTWNILDIVPKDRMGNPIEDLNEARIDANKQKPGIQEVKEWIGVLEFIKSFIDIDGDGLVDIPKKYKGKLGRIVIEASWNPVALLSKGNYITKWVFSLFVLFLIIAGLLIYYLTHLKKRRG
ncbi:MAG: bifunctional UDP-sugar hydrolase/5'-nucleotidase [Spirochaetota bacterium]|nr:bifunctional UDP-sugar hydrolase/5'-nucleotidase [Spirochaetota bacterium]